MGLILARHGETLFNVQERLQGVSDSNLTDKGIEQAAKLGEFLLNYRIGRILSSPLKRAVDTSSIANSKVNSNIQLEDALKEISYGEWEAKEKEELKNLSMWKEREANRFNFIHPGGESYENLYNRLKPFLETLNDLLNDEENYYVLVSHQGVMLCAYIHFLNLNIDESKDLRIPNNEVAVLAKNNGRLVFNKHLL